VNLILGLNWLLRNDVWHELSEVNLVRFKEVRESIDDPDRFQAKLWVVHLVVAIWLALRDPKVVKGLAHLLIRYEITVVVILKNN
jgi:hypothetical protein